MNKRIPRKTLAMAIIGLGITMLPACHTLRFDIESATPATVIEDTHWFYLYGLFPTREVDVSLKCPQGAGAIKEQTTFNDGFIGVITLGIVIPRSVWYYCLPANPPAPPLRKEETK